MIKYGIVFLAVCAFTGATYRPRFDGRIVGGEEVDIKDFPWQVSLREQGYHNCGGSIIAANWVLTASHCVYGSKISDISFRAGSTNNAEGGTIHNALEIKTHPQYGNLDYDFALVKVDTPFPIDTTGVATISMADKEPADETLCTVSGWGYTQVTLPKHLMAVNVTIVNHDVCNKDYDGGVTSRMICAADPGKDSCQGDSGGPLIDTLKKELIGIVSWGAGCAQQGYPGVYSNVAWARDWIKQNSGV